MSTVHAPTALMAEDEPLLAASLRKMLKAAWPELAIVAEAGDGESAVALALDATPDVLFLDIRMPGKSGLAVAETVVDEWPDDRPAPLIVFITAYDEFALAAFDVHAVDYVLKPVTEERLARALDRVRTRLAARTERRAEGDLLAMLTKLQAITRPSSNEAAGTERLDAIHVGVGNTVRLVPIDDVVFFEATDKYVAVHTRDSEGLIRMSMRELAARLDPSLFVQVHRGVIVRRSRIASATRDESGRMTLALRDGARTVPVSRAFAHLFRPM